MPDFSEKYLELTDLEEPARVLMAVPQYPYPVIGGLERQSHELAKCLVEYGVDVQVLSGRILPSQHGVEDVEGVTVYRIRWPRNRFFRYIQTFFSVTKFFILKRNTFDVVHLHQFSWFALLIILLSKMLGKPVLTKMPNTGPDGILEFSKKRFGKFKLWILKKTDAVVAMTEATIKELLEVNYPMERVLFAPNGITLSERSVRSHAYTDSLKLCRVVFVGGLREQKGVEDLLYMWRDVVREVQCPTRLELWGTGHLGDQLKSLSQELGIEDSVLFCGHVDSVREKLCDMDIFVLFSSHEGNSNAILEAMAAGLPIVSTRVGGASMQVGEVGARFLVDLGDREGFKECLFELIENSSLREDVGEAMYRRISESFDIKKVALTYIQAYTYLIRGYHDYIGSIDGALSIKN